jgi:two-component system, sensor histidine kinase and response regulator
MRILVAEDNAVNQVIIRRMLEKWNMCVDVVGDGAQAVSRVGQGAYDLVLMDNQMPVLDGVEAARAIRAPGNRIPIVAFTAGAMDWERQRCLSAGMNEVLGKPVQASALEAVLRRYAPSAECASGREAQPVRSPFKAPQP